MVSSKSPINQIFSELPTNNKAVTAIMAGFFAATSLSLPAHALSKAEMMSLTYEQVKGTGLANRCAEVKGEGTINLTPGKKHQITDFCVEPTSFQVRKYFFCFVAV